MINKANLFISPNKVIYGNGTVNLVGKEAEQFGAKKALIVTDKGVTKADLLTGVQDSLKAQKIDFQIFDQIEAEAPARNIDDGAKMAVDYGADVIIGVGGGSSQDAAKGIAIIAKLGGNILDFAGFDLVPQRGLPKILLPTTAGTGSEVTRVGVFKDETENMKKAVYSNFALADVAIVDPLLTLSMPPKVTADTGIDAMIHAIEAYASLNATPFSEIMALEAIRLIAENLPTAYAKAANITARANMSLAATLAGLALNSAGAAAIHGLSNFMGIKFKMSHGRANAVLLPYVVDYNKIGDLNRYAMIAQAVGIDTEGLSPYEAAEELVDYLFNLLAIIDIPVRLSDYGITEADIPSLVEGGMKLARLFVPNPRDMTEEDVKDIFTNAL